MDFSSLVLVLFSVCFCFVFVWLFLCLWFLRCFSTLAVADLHFAISADTAEAEF